MINVWSQPNSTWLSQATYFRKHKNGCNVLMLRIFTPNVVWYEIRLFYYIFFKHQKLYNILQKALSLTFGNKPCLSVSKIPCEPLGIC